MIGSLRGTLLEFDDDGTVLIEAGAGGVGYRVVLDPAGVRSLGDPGDEVFVWVYHHIREDTQVLYGFTERAERRTFEILLGAHGVGPALALAILSIHRPDALARIIAADDADALCLVPGVGKKTAARLLIELKSRFEVPLGADHATRPAGGATSGSADVRAALERLGFRSEEITRVLQLPAVHDAPDVSAGVREALKHLGAGR